MKGGSGGFLVKGKKEERKKEKRREKSKRREKEGIKGERKRFFF